MKLDDNFYKTFLDEMHALENFRMAYAAAHTSVPLDRDDPDVRRLIESMAFFATRARQAAKNNIIAWRLRIFRQFFPYLLTPLPAMGMLKVKTSGRFTEPVFLPKGTQIAVSPGKTGTAFFNTLRDLNIYPISLNGAETLLLPNKGFRFLLHFKTSYPRSDEVGQLNFHINHLDNYHASLHILYTLKAHLKSTIVVFNEKATETSKGVPCDISFGMGDDEEQELEWAHPLEKERLFFHFPQQELFLNIHIPSPPGNWSNFTICFDLDSKWPRNLRLNQDIFQLFTVPIANIKQGMAQPITCEGTKERYPIRYPDMENRFELHSVKGVYKVETNGMVPIRPGILAGGEGSYEIEQSVDSKGVKRGWLNLHFPQAFKDPKTVTIDAFWLQTWFSEAMRQKLEVVPYNRDIKGVEWNLQGDIVQHMENQLQDDLDVYLHILTLKNKSALNFDDLNVLLQAMGIMKERYFQRIFDHLVDLRVEEAPNLEAGRASEIKYVYSLRFREFDPNDLPLVGTFMIHLGIILNIWISEKRVEVRRETANVNGDRV